METMAARYGGVGKSICREQQQQHGGEGQCYFQMPLHYPRYSREDYEAMPEWQLDRLLSEYGLSATGTLHHKRAFAMGTFLWGAANHH
ncbi:hypothetical protein HU200_014882 [Digitaria exilis]|uniref:DUF7722 domain-containing protein n=1 Tax=Digitaria exilis TaxID=1010633 RepID=A0A835KJW5_9POAL|nr:hypothetical protein HU200_014882 [Digitaria exilis]CAB3471707.1 unnamed protein product [Digitaria exilis]